MTGGLLRWAVFLSGLFLLPVAIIRAQPYDDRDLRAFLTPPEGCPAPCFMGIRPGVTRAEEAIAILETHAWVDFLWREYGDVPKDTVDYVTSSQAPVSWQWSESSPGWINKAVNGFMDFDREQYVERMVIETDVKVWNLLLALGQPDSVQMNIYDRPETQTRVLSYSAWYADDGIFVSTFEACPAREFELSAPLTFLEIAPEAREVESTGASC